MTVRFNTSSIYKESYVEDSRNVRKAALIFWSSADIPLWLYIIFSLSIHDGNSLLHLADISGCPSFHHILIHDCDEGNSNTFELVFIIDVLASRVGMIIRVMSLNTWRPSMNLHMGHTEPDAAYWYYLTTGCARTTTISFSCTYLKQP